MAVGTQEDTFSLPRRGPPRAKGSLRARRREGLQRRIEVVDVQAGQAPVVAAEGAGASSFFDKHALDLSPALLDGVHATAWTPESIRSAAHEDDLAVPVASALDRLEPLGTSLRFLREPAGARRREPVAR